MGGPRSCAPSPGIWKSSRPERQNISGWQGNPFLTARRRWGSCWSRWCGCPCRCLIGHRPVPLAGTSTALWLKISLRRQAAATKPRSAKNTMTTYKTHQAWYTCWASHARKVHVAHDLNRTSIFPTILAKWWQIACQLQAKGLEPFSLILTLIFHTACAKISSSSEYLRNPVPHTLLEGNHHRTCRCGVDDF